MADFNEARSSLTKENIHYWARNVFPSAFCALPELSPWKWIRFDPATFVISRSVWRSLDRSLHKQLLIIGDYAPGSVFDDEPSDRVVAHVHPDETEVSFYRISQVISGGDGLISVPSTSSVAFHTPFNKVGDENGGSASISRVSALILYYFLAAGYIEEVQRTKSNLTMFTRNFRDACSWIENGGQRPLVTQSRNSSNTLAMESVPAVSVKTSTISIASPPPVKPLCAPPVISRSKTDDSECKRRRYENDAKTTTVARPKKHPRRTLSEQIQTPKLLHGDLLSPRSPAPERVHQALSDRIQHLKDENAGLKEDNAALQLRIKQDAHEHKFALQQLLRLETRVDDLIKRVNQAEENATAAKEDATLARNEAASARAGLMDINEDLTRRLIYGIGK